MANQNLSTAKKAKNDEFYTHFADVEKEMNAYLEYDEDLFRGKTVLLPCDDPEWSNFTKYFAQNFERLGIKRLISTSYAAASKGRLLVLDQDTTKDGKIDHKDLRWDYLEGDGDFRSAEVTKLRDQADIVITNPPFSLFREYISWLLASKVKFAIIGNVNAITYKQVFPHIKSNKVWLGATMANASAEFRVPDAYPLTGSKTRSDDSGRKFITVPGISWFTNIDHGRRHQPLSLMTMSENLKFSKHQNLKDSGYQKYDNYDAIEVPFTDAIPSDYPGVMGVPITFFSKYNPDQFEIIGLAAGNIRGLAGIPTSTGKDGPYIGGKLKYGRILIKHKPKKENE